MNSSAGLDLKDFRLLDLPELPPELRISQSFAWFHDCLYVGLGRGPLHGPGADGQDAAVGARLLCYDPATNAWREAWRGPMVDGVARDRSVRAMAVSDDYLYCAVGSLSGQVVMLRSKDGHRFDEWGLPGLGQGDADIASVRSLVAFKGRLHTSPTGKNKGRGMADDNMADLPIVFASDKKGGWRVASDVGFGDAGNLSINELVVFAGCLYAGTYNKDHGFQLWKTDAKSGLPYRWHKVIDQGAWRYAANPVPAAMHVFGDALYVGTGVQRQGGEGLDHLGPIAPELVRVNADDSWELVCGEPRATPDGLRLPLSGLGAGFGLPYTQTFWRMAEHSGWLYLGTSDWRFWPTYLRGREDLSEERRLRLREDSRGYSGQYALWKSHDGSSWQAVTTEGIGNNNEHYGIRELLSTPVGLAVAAASRGKQTGGIALWLGAAE